jgi:hypothetical protein
MVAPMTKGIAEQIAKWRAYADDLCDAGGEPDDTCGRDKARAEIYRACATTLEKLAADHLEAVQTPQEEKLQELERERDELYAHQLDYAKLLMQANDGEPTITIRSAIHRLFTRRMELERDVARLSGSAVQTPPTEKDPSEVKPPQGPDNWITREGVRPKV